MIGWIKERLFRKEEPATTIVVMDDRQREQLAIQQELGFDPCDSVQSWLRLHQLLKSHEDRITALEKKRRKNDHQRHDTSS